MARMMMAVKQELRPCIVNGKTKALFHAWEQYGEIITPSILKGGHPGGQLMSMCGLCELEDGHIVRANPVDIKFLDSKHAEYDFTDDEEA